MPEGEVSFNLDDLKDALPEFQDAVHEIQMVISTVGGALDGLDEFGATRGKYASESFENQLQFITDRLKKAIEDYEEVLGEPVIDPETGLPTWPTGPGSGGSGSDDDDDHGHGSGGHGSKPPKDKDQDDDDHPHGAPPGQSGTGDGTAPGNSDSAPGQSQSTGSGTGQSGQSGTGSGTPSGSGAIPPVPGVGGTGSTSKKTDEEEEEDELLEDGEFQTPGYVSPQNQPIVQDLAEKQLLLTETRTRLATLEEDRVEKAETLQRLQAAAAANPDSGLEERIERLKQEITDIDTELYYGQENIPELEAEIEALKKRLEFVAIGPDADIDAIRALEGGETSQWIRDATRNEDNSVNCVNYVVNRMPIPPELPFNAHLWDEQVMKHGPKYGMSIGTVPLEGSVLVMEREHSYANDIYGHVMYVEKVEDGIVWVTDNNYPDKLVRLDHLTTETSGPYIKYLYFPWQTKV